MVQKKFFTLVIAIMIFQCIAVSGNAQDSERASSNQAEASDAVEAGSTAADERPARTELRESPRPQREIRTDRNLSIQSEMTINPDGTRSFGRPSPFKNTSPAETEPSPPPRAKFADHPESLEEAAQSAIDGSASSENVDNLMIIGVVVIIALMFAASFIVRRRQS